MRSLIVDIIKQTFHSLDEPTLHKRLYKSVCNGILDGSLQPATRLPPSRDLAGELALSRNTVLRVYEQLQAEGYITTRTSSGTFVTDSVLDNLGNQIAPPDEDATQDEREILSDRCQLLLSHASANPRQWGAFIPGVPDVESFPHRMLTKIQSRLARQPEPEYLTYDVAGGDHALKLALVDYLRTARGVNCSTHQVLITEGVHQALDLIIRSLCNPGDCAWTEEPGYWGIKNILRMNDVESVPVPVDEQGMQPPEQMDKIPKLIFVTPSHQYPLGPVMSLARRKQLLALARKSGSWIVEDDYDSEFRFAGNPIPSLQGLEADSPVIYIGTFSKTLYPSLRMGYVILPRRLATPLKTAHSELYRGGHLLMQAALAEFIAEGMFSAHIRKMRQLYGRRRACLVALIEQNPGPEALGRCNSNAGLHLTLALPDAADDEGIASQASQAGILVRPLSRYFSGEKKQKGLLIGFASMPEELMPFYYNKLLSFIPPAFQKHIIKPEA